MAEGRRDGDKVRQYCTNFRCLFRRTCFKAVPPEEGEEVALFHSPLDDINCPFYETMLSKYDLTDHTQEYLDRHYKKYCVRKKRVV